MRRSHGAQHRVLCLVQKTPHFREEFPTGIGQKNALANALEQKHAKLAFKVLDLSAHRALGEIQFMRSLGETAVARSAFKGLQRGDVRDQSSTQLHSILALT